MLYIVILSSFKSNKNTHCNRVKYKLSPIYIFQGVFLDQSVITPLSCILPSLILKTASGYNPVVYAINHPRFRLAMAKSFPGFCINEKEFVPDNSTKGEEKA